MDDDWTETEEEWLERRIGQTRADVERLIHWGFLKQSKDWITAWYRNDLRWSHGGGGCLLIRKDRIEGFVQAAREKPDVFDLAMFVSATRVEQGVEIPEPLRRLTSECLKREFSRPAGRPGRSKNWGRDAIILNVMYQLTERNDIPATRRHDLKGVRARRTSASEIVFEALKKTEIGHVDIQRINGIWNSKKDGADYSDAMRSYVFYFFSPDWDDCDRDDWV